MNIELSETRSTASSFLERYQLTIFFVLVMAASIMASTVGYVLENEGFAMLALFSPSITAIILTALMSGRGGLRDLLVKQLVRPVAWRWLLVAAFLIPAVAALFIWHPTVNLHCAHFIWRRVWLARIRPAASAKKAFSLGGQSGCGTHLGLLALSTVLFAPYGYTRRHAIWRIYDLGYYRFNLDYLGLQQQQKRFNGYHYAFYSQRRL